MILLLFSVLYITPCSFTFLALPIFVIVVLSLNIPLSNDFRGLFFFAACAKTLICPEDALYVSVGVDFHLLLLGPHVRTWQSVQHVNIMTSCPALQNDPEYTLFWYNLNQNYRIIILSSPPPPSPCKFHCFVLVFILVFHQLLAWGGGGGGGEGAAVLYYPHFMCY